VATNDEISTALYEIDEEGNKLCVAASIETLITQLTSASVVGK
jgi:hypothetical protein